MNLRQNMRRAVDEVELYRVATLSEIEESINKQKQIVPDYLKGQGPYFLRLFNAGNFKEAVEVIRKDAKPGYSHVTHKFIALIEARNRIIRGEKIYTTLHRRW